MDSAGEKKKDKAKKKVKVKNVYSKQVHSSFF